MTFSCRSFLREALADPAVVDAAGAAHVASCAFCRDRLKTRERLLPALRARASLPVDSRALLAGVHSRIVEQAERSELGRLLDGAMPVAMPDVAVASRDGASWPEVLLDSKTADLARTDPRSPSGITWSRVRGQILARIAAEALGNVRRRWILGVASAAAIAIVLSITSRGESGNPRIVFRDLNAGELASLGNFEFVVVRHGANR